MWKQNQSMAGSQSAVYDQGLRSFMLNVYNYMGAGLVITGLVAMLFANNASLMQLIYRVEAGQIVGMSPLGWVAMLAPIGFVFFLSFKIQSISFKTAQLVFWLYAGVMGVSLSSLLMMYTGTSVARVFFITAAVFGSMSLYGYTTKRDLTGFGSFLMMGVFGLIIASIVNIFMQSSVMQFVLSVISVLIFTGLTAYDTQRLKGIYASVADSGEMAGKMAVMGALNLYMDFINLFINLLRLMGDRR